MIVDFYKKNENLLLILLAFIHLLLSTISNYSIASYIIKTSSVIILSKLILHNHHFNFSIYKSRLFRKALLLLIILLTIFSVSLIYSRNWLFGFEKIIHFILGPVFMVFVIYFLSSIVTETDYKRFTLIVSVIVVISVITASIINPFDFSEKYYQFRIGNWSHIIFGIFLSLSLLLILFSYISETNIKYNILYSVSILIGIFGLYISIPRSSIIALTISSAIFIVYSLLKNKQKSSFYKIIIPLLISFTMMLFLERDIKGPEKSLQKVFSVFTDKGYGDLSIQSRLKSYEISLKMIKGSPILGVGFGGFKSYYESTFPIEIEYPHNILIEFQTETGIIGSLLFLFLIVLALIKIPRNDIRIFSVFLYGLIFAFFSKDIPSNTIIFIGIFYLLSNNKKNK